MTLHITRSHEVDAVLTEHKRSEMSKSDTSWLAYRNVLKFSDRQIRANSADPDQEQSDQGLHCLQFPLHLLDTLL